MMRKRERRTNIRRGEHPNCLLSRNPSFVVCICVSVVGCVFPSYLCGVQKRSIFAVLLDWSSFAAFSKVGEGGNSRSEDGRKVVLTY